MVYEVMNKRAVEVVLNALFPPQHVASIEMLYKLVDEAEQRGHEEGYDAGFEVGRGEGYAEGYEAGFLSAEENIYGSDMYDEAELEALYEDFNASMYEDVDVAASALNLDETLTLPAYEGDSSDETEFRGC
jgi:hypothetical protein